MFEGRSMSALELRTMEEIMAWHSEIQFVEGRVNHIADWLSRYPVQKTPICSTGLLMGQKISVQAQARQLDTKEDAHLKLVEKYLILGVIPPSLGADDRVVVKRFASQFVIQGGKLSRCLMDSVVPVV